MKFTHTTIIAVISILVIGSPQIANAATQNDVAGFWTFDIQPSFNLVAFPVMPNTSTVQAVVGDALGEVEITTWDSRLNRYRWAHFDPRSGAWSGDLFILERGAAYWIKLIGADEPRRLVVKGHPEQYTRFRWTNLGRGWTYYAPTIGHAESLEDLPPANANDLAVAWNNDLDRFELAEAQPGDRWHASNRFDGFQPDRAYIAYLNTRALRPIGPPTELEDDLNHREAPGVNGEGDRVRYQNPPYPVIVGNRDGLPVCNPDGGVCNGDFTVNVIREDLRIGPGGDLEPYQENVGSYEVAPGNAAEGKFRLALTVSSSDEFLQSGDRVYLLVQGAQGASTVSTSFEIPGGNDRFIPDVSFENPMSFPGEPPVAPQRFSLATPFPNPFNDRFMVEFHLPQIAPVSYRLYDLTGRIAWDSERPFQAGVHRLTIQAGNLAAGIYMLEVKTPQHRGLAKVAHIK